MSRFLSPGTLTILILAIMAGLVAAYAIRGLIGTAPPAPASLPTMVEVPLASANLPAGRTIVLGDISIHRMTQEQFANQPWPMNRLMLDPEQVMGRTLKSPITEGQPFITSSFYLVGQGPNFVEELPDGFRAVAVQVPFERGGFVGPGMIVDVLFRSLSSAGDEETPPIPEMTIVLVEGAEVLARETFVADPGKLATNSIDLRRDSRMEGERPSTIVLAVSPADANKIDAVRNHGEFTLTTRRPTDVNFGGPPPPTSLEDVLGIESLASLPPEPPPPPTVTEIYRRGSRQVNAFEFRDNRFVPLSGSEPL